ncbi:MAG: PQQ-binding-like beta-propeller repeat protein [Bacteroidales bacterium]|jgi:outer membrane protein assembly factor BamB|nr:PQQ-binding-like beta-propeller repeat protein [Bacteroidales bacterium]
MKTSKYILLVITFLVPVIFILTGCDKDTDGPDNKITPVWTYDTGEDPYQSTPCVTGDKVIVCTTPADDDDNSKAGTHCINRNTGALIWKVNDSVTEMVTSPIIYNNLILEGGLNPHARRVSDGGVEWKYVDEFLKVSMYSNPLLVGDAAYFACMFHIVKVNAASGAELWQTQGLYNNLRLAGPVFKNGRIYYADGSYNKVTAFFEDSGQVEWDLAFEGAFANKPLVTDNELFVGIQDSDINTKTLRCINLSDKSEKWGVKLGSVVADLTLNDGKIYAIGLQRLHCRSAADGSEIWHHDLVAGAVSEPLVVGDKLIVGYGKGLICLNASTGAVNWDYKSGGSNQTIYGFSTPTLEGDHIYVSCSDGKVYCFKIN